MDDYRPSWIAARWGVSPEYLHQLCKEFGLVRLRVNPMNRLRPRWRFPQPTVDKLAELLHRESFKGGEAAGPERIAKYPNSAQP